MAFKLKHTDELKEQRALGRSLIVLGVLLLLVAIISCAHGGGPGSGALFMGGLGLAVIGRLLDWIFRV